MNGPEHYAEAERLLAAQELPSSVPGYGRIISAEADPVVIAAAQVHALLALCVEQGAGPPRPTINLILKGDFTEETLSRLRMALKEATGNATVGITDGGAS
jgi:hypothetical protein